MKEITKNTIKEFSPLALAFIGDGVHTLFVRNYVMQENNLTAGNFHLLASKICKASTQAYIFDEIFNCLTEDEKAVSLQARNHKSHCAKNANPEDYRKATAFEAVIGYLYLLKEEDRLKNLLNNSIKIYLEMERK